MGLMDRLRPRKTTTTLVEAAPATAPAPPAHVVRAGFDAGVPRGGTSEWRQTTAAGDRAGRMRDLYAAYITCPWASAGVGAIVRTVTAGGLDVKWDQDDDEGDQAQPDEPVEVTALRSLLAWCNPTQDVIQLLSNALTDLLVYGDAFIEVTWLGGIPIALWNLDAPSTTPIADEHGTVTSYVQSTDQSQRAEFDLHEVIHISLNDSASGVFGVSPVAKAELPITAWLWTAATLKETFRKGNPPAIHVDFPQSQDSDALRWSGQYMVNNVGPRNIGNPIVTIRGGVVKELQEARIEEYLRAKDQLRDEILSTLGVPPAKVGVIESGNLGGGTGESQDRSFMVTTCAHPTGLLLEKLNFHIVQQGFGIKDWKVGFGEIDWRDSKVIEDIRDARLRNGSWTLNRYRDEIDEPPVDGGDQAVLVDRQNIVLWSSIKDMSDAMISSKQKAPAPNMAPQKDGDEPVDGTGTEPADAKDDKASKDAQEPGQPPEAKPGDKDTAKPDTKAGKGKTGPAETHVPDVWVERYRAVRAAMEERADV